MGPTPVNSIKKSAKFKVTATFLVLFTGYIFWLIPTAFVNIYGITDRQKVIDSKTREIEQATVVNDQAKLATLFEAHEAIVAKQRQEVSFLQNILLYNGSASVIFEFLLLFFMVRYTYQEQLRRQRLDQEFIAVTSHELRTPLTAIRGHISMIMEGGLSKKEEQASLVQANSSTQQLSILVERLLEISRLEHQDMHYRREPLDPAEIVEAAMTTVADRANDRDIALTVSKSKRRATASQPYGDSERWAAAVSAVLQNAVQYSNPQGRVSVVISEEGGRTQLIITDHGVGVQSRNQRKVFEKFFREHNMYSDAGGLGIGLYLAQQIIKQQGGTITLSSEPEQGTTVSISFPAPQTATAPVAHKALAPGS